MKSTIKPTTAANISAAEPRIAIFAGSFNPFTVGHASIVERGLELFDVIIVAIGVNARKTVTPDEAGQRRQRIESLYADNPRVRVVVWDGLTVDLARREGAHFLIRGVRDVANFEYERAMADVNRRIAGIETVLLFSLPEHASVSSSVVRELESYHVDVSEFLPRTTND